MNHLSLKQIYTTFDFGPFFLDFCFFLKTYALFLPNFYKSISALSRLLRIDKNFVKKKRCSKTELYPFTNKCFWKTFGQHHVTVWLMRMWTLDTQETQRKKTYFFMEKKKTYKADTVLSYLYLVIVKTMTIYHLRFTPARRKTLRTKNGSGLLIPSIVQMTIYFQWKKTIKVHWFDFEKSLIKKNNKKR